MEARLTVNIKIGGHLLGTTETRMVRASESLAPEWYPSDTTAFPLYTAIDSPEDLELINGQANQS
ncbi:MAG: hypothetical protein HY671_01410 [Chloroflexi bacterium]|nr:hypothetical protein [Chloroflexota bacterium]